MRGFGKLSGNPRIIIARVTLSNYQIFNITWTFKKNACYIHNVFKKCMLHILRTFEVRISQNDGREEEEKRPPCAQGTFLVH